MKTEEIERDEDREDDTNRHRDRDRHRSSPSCYHWSTVLDGAQISAEEYEIMKDLMIPLGRVPEFSTQSGG